LASGPTNVPKKTARIRGCRGAFLRGAVQQTDQARDIDLGPGFLKAFLAGGSPGFRINRTNRGAKIIRLCFLTKDAVFSVKDIVRTLTWASGRPRGRNNSAARI
jgi:hypothetical protein